MKPAIEILNLGKLYRRQNTQRYLALRDILANPFSRLKKSQEDFWALKDINLSIEPGERIGIIGRNGAGKSTLLKIISRITPPTTGEAFIRGRVGSLLEVGTGFHPELTGRENIYLNGSILGLKKVEINRQLDAIIEFSGIEKFIDTPLKHYSSGMQLRIAFSVAAHLEPEILLIDEVLAVGDIEFQQKCLGKMEEVSKKDGRTILFVSHDLNAVSLLTRKCIFLENGEIKKFGNTPEIIQAYYETRNSQRSIYTRKQLSDKPFISLIQVITSQPDSIHIHSESLRVRFAVTVPEKRDKLAISFQIMNRQMQPIIHVWYVSDLNGSFTEAGEHEVTCSFPSLKLYKGQYYIKAYLGDDKGKEVLDHVPESGNFEVVMTGIDPGQSYGWQDNSCVYRENEHWAHVKK
jgi:lipopolysaccharide transport system ATP-binding protein